MAKTRAQAMKKQTKTKKRAVKKTQAKRKAVKKTQKIEAPKDYGPKRKVASAFTGAGIGDVGLAKVFDIAKRSEIDDLARKVLAHHDHVNVTKDVSEWCYDASWNDIVGIAGGVPCTNTCWSGNRAGPYGEVTKSWLTLHGVCEASVAAHNPISWVFLENSDGALQPWSNQRSLVAEWARKWTSLGYKCAWRVLCQEQFSPMVRTRVVFVATWGIDPRDILLGDFVPKSKAGDAAAQYRERQGLALVTNLSRMSVGKAVPTWTGSTACCVHLGVGQSRGATEHKVVTPEGVEKLMGVAPGFTAAQGLTKEARFSLLGRAASAQLFEYVGTRLAEAGNGFPSFKYANNIPAAKFDMELVAKFPSSGFASKQGGAWDTSRTISHWLESALAELPEKKTLPQIFSDKAFFCQPTPKQAQDVKGSKAVDEHAKISLNKFPHGRTRLTGKFQLERWHADDGSFDLIQVDGSGEHVERVDLCAHRTQRFLSCGVDTYNILYWSP